MSNSSNDSKDQDVDYTELFDNYADSQDAYIESLRKWQEEQKKNSSINRDIRWGREY